MGFSTCRCSILSFECINVKWREHHEWTCGHETWLILTIWSGLQTCLMCALAFSHHSAHMWVEKRISAKKCYQKFAFCNSSARQKIIPLESMNTSSFSLFGQALDKLARPTLLSRKYQVALCLAQDSRSSHHF